MKAYAESEIVKKQMCKLYYCNERRIKQYRTSDVKHLSVCSNVLGSIVAYYTDRFIHLLYRVTYVEEGYYYIDIYFLRCNNILL